MSALRVVRLCSCPAPAVVLALCLALVLLVAPAAFAAPPGITGLSSPTHPSSSTWYKSNSPTFQWNPAQATDWAVHGYSFVLDQASGTAPDSTVDVSSDAYDERDRYALGDYPCWIAIADFDRDGVEDMAVANGGLFVFLGTGDGTFNDPTSATTAPHANSVAAADFNGDGIIDLATGSNSEAVVSVLPGNGDGTFQARITTSTNDGLGGAPDEIAAADFNGDGKVDLVAKALGSTVQNAYLIVLFGKGDATFTRSVIGSPTNPRHPKPVDIDGDGHVDIVLTDSEMGAPFPFHYVGVIYGQGNGNFSGPTLLSTAGIASVDVADLNGDGRKDIVTAGGPGGDVGGTVSVLMSSGARTFAPHVEYATGPAAELPHDEDFDGRVEAVDLDNDGIKDLVVANYAGDSVSVLKGAGDGTFGFHADYQTGHRPTFVAVADLNGDGRSDVVAADQVAGEVSVFRGRGDCTLAAALVDHDAWDPTSVAVGDFDGDGADDVAVANAGTGAMTPSPFLAVLPGDGDGSFSPGLYTATDGRPEFVVSADFNGDGKLDLAAADTSSADQIQVLLGDGHGHFAARVDYPMGGWPASSLAVGDFNADGDPDLAAGAFGYVRVFIGRGDGVFDIGIDVPMKFGTTGSARACSLAVSDITGDGIQDIVTANKDVLAPVAVLVGNGDGTFVAYPHKPAVESYSAIAAGDFNGDGKQDVAVALDLDASVAILLNTGSGFTLKGHYALMAEAEALVAADFNSDGHVDVASGDTVRLGNGDGSLGVGWAYEGGGPLDIGDFNGDGHVDLAAADYGADAIRVSLHTPSTRAQFFGKSSGTWYFHVRAVDANGVGGQTSTLAVKIDATAPVPADNADSLWHQGGFTLNLSGSDASSGVARITVNRDGRVFSVSAASLSLAFDTWKRGGGSGTHTVSYRIYDRAGNSTSLITRTVKIDGKPPQTANDAPRDSTGAPVPQSQALTVHLTAADQITLSGIKETWWSLDGGSWTKGTSVSVPAVNGYHFVRYYSVDNAGNSESVRACTVRMVLSAKALHRGLAARRT